MLLSTPQGNQKLFLGNGLINQFDLHALLVLLAHAIFWQSLDEKLSAGYTFQKERPSKNRGHPLFNIV